MFHGAYEIEAIDVSSIGIAYVKSNGMILRGVTHERVDAYYLQTTPPCYTALCDKLHVYTVSKTDKTIHSIQSMLANHPISIQL